jgi:alkaline phosphatase
MKLRNQLLALTLLLGFIALGFVFFKKWAVQKPFGIIVFVSDGLSTNTLTAARFYEQGADRRLNLESFPHLALVANAANDFAVPDAASAASAIATGVKGNNRALALDPRVDGKPLPSLLALAKEAGRATGLVTTGRLTDATPAAFYAHTADARDSQGIALQFVKDARLNLAMGGGLADFTPESKGGQRKDGRDLWLELRGKGVTQARTKAELENTPAFLTGPLVGLFADGDLAYSSQVQSGSQQPSLADMVRRSIEFLQTSRSGYLLVVDAALISRAASQNRGEQVFTETIDFDRAIAAAREYAGENALILAVGKHDVGGFALNGYPLRGDHGLALLGKSASGAPAVTWSTGPNGPNGPNGPASADTTGSAAIAVPSEPAAFQAPEALNTARDMIAIGVGPGSEAVHGFLDNTEIFRILQGAL